MAIDVYWTCTEKEWMLAEKPDSVLKSFYASKNLDPKNHLTKINACPFFNHSLKNTFAIRSIYNYSFEIKGNDIFSNDHDQNFFDNHVLIRSIEEQFFSFLQRFIFFTEENSLEVEILPAFLEETDFQQKCILVPGEINIAKWFRNFEFAFFIKKDFKRFSIKQGDPLYYLKFKTNEKINFKQFRFSKELEDLTQDRINLVNLQYIKKINDYYKYFKNKKIILKNIKENLV